MRLSGDPPGRFHASLFALLVALGKRVGARLDQLARLVTPCALLDFLTHHVHILEMNGDGYRLAQSKSR